MSLNSHKTQNKVSNTVPGVEQKLGNYFLPLESDDWTCQQAPPPTTSALTAKVFTPNLVLQNGPQLTAYMPHWSESSIWAGLFVSLFTPSPEARAGTSPQHPCGQLAGAQLVNNG